MDSQALGVGADFVGEVLAIGQEIRVVVSELLTCLVQDRGRRDPTT